MIIRRPLPLPTDPADLRRQQEALSKQLELVPGDPLAERVAGADVAYSLDQRLAWAAVVVLDRASGRTLEESTWAGEAPAPYKPGRFALREAECLLECFRRLSIAPDTLLIDGHGTAHPQRFGLACHLGLSLDLPTIGCAKSRLCGRHEPLSQERGAWVPLIDHGDVIGSAVRTRTGVRPVYVSPGHRFDVETATGLVLSAATDFRLPEPLRAAHQLANRLRARARAPSKGSGMNADEN